MRCVDSEFRSNLFMVVSAYSPEDEVERQSLNMHTIDQPIMRCTKALTFEEDIIYEDGIVRRETPSITSRLRRLTIGDWR